jgi:hypothetical protein
MSHLIQLSTGIEVDVFNITPDQVRIEDIRNSLSKICRYGGHCSYFYSVLEHSLHVVDLMEFVGVTDRALLLEGLLHDAAEAYIGDIPRPLKNVAPFHAFNHSDAVISQTIMHKFGANTIADSNEYKMSDAVKYADDMMLFIEWPHLMTGEMPVPKDSLVQSLDEISSSPYYRRIQKYLNPKTRKVGHPNTSFFIDVFIEYFTKFTT